MKTRTGFVSNSSSSSFVCDTKKSITEVNEDLKVLLDFWNKWMPEHWDSDDLTERKFEDVFGEIFIADEKHEKMMTEDWQYEEPAGRLIIRSADDNSIPCEMFELIERKFNGYRNHLG